MIPLSSFLAASTPYSSQPLILDPNGRIQRCRFAWNPKQNRRIWKAYQAALNPARAARDAKLLGVDFNTWKPFTAGIPAKFLLAEAVDVRLSDLPQRNLTAVDLERVMKRPTPLHKKIDPLTIHGMPTEYLACLFHSPELMLHERYSLFADVEHLSWLKYLERFCKAIANRELPVGSLVPAPWGDYYYVYNKIASGDGLVAYALKPFTKDTKLQPLVVFRPTQLAPSQEDVIPTHLNDLQEKVGKWGYDSAKGRLTSLVRAPGFLEKGQRLQVAGYSLGGTHAQRFIADHYDLVSDAYFFADPSIDEETAEAFAKKINALPPREEKINFNIFRTWGDPAHSVGGKHLGWGIRSPNLKVTLYELDPRRERVPRMSRHFIRVRDTDVPYADEEIFTDPGQLDRKLDVLRQGARARYLEFQRRQLGNKYLFGFFYTLYQVASAATRLLRLPFIRATQQTSPISL